MTPPASPRARLLLGLSGAAIFSLTFLGAFTGRFPLPEVSVRWKTKAYTTYRPANPPAGGPELALIFIGSSMCADANHPQLPEALERLKTLIRQKALATNRSFTTVGIASDLNVNAGTAYLKKFGAFDEVMIGRGWFNEGLMKYIWKDFPGAAATPQVVVIDRLAKRKQGTHYGLDNEELIARKVGTEEIFQWLKNEVHLPIHSQN